MRTLIFLLLLATFSFGVVYIPGTWDDRIEGDPFLYCNGYLEVYIDGQVIENNSTVISEGKHTIKCEGIRFEGSIDLAEEIPFEDRCNPFPVSSENWFRVYVDDILMNHKGFEGMGDTGGDVQITSYFPDGNSTISCEIGWTKAEFIEQFPEQKWYDGAFIKRTIALEVTESETSYWWLMILMVCLFFFILLDLFDKKKKEDKKNHIY